MRHDSHLLYICARAWVALMLPVLAACGVGQSDPSGHAGQHPLDTVPMLVTQVRQCARLYAAECKVHKIVTHEDKLRLKGSLFDQDFNIPLPMGERKIAIPMEATLKAYIDFSDFSASNIRKFSGGRIEIVLPDPKVELTGSRIIHDEVKSHVPFIRSEFTDKELTAYERQGRASILQSIPQLNLTEQARQSATRTLVAIAQSLGYNADDIIVSFRQDFQPNNVRALLDANTLEHATK